MPAVCVSTDFIANKVRQIARIPQNELTAERIAAEFADSLSATFEFFDRDDFQHKTGISARMIEDAEAKSAGAQAA